MLTDNEEISPVANLSDDRKIEKELSKTLRTAEGIVAELVAMVSEQRFRKNYCS